MEMNPEVVQAVEAFEASVAALAAVLDGKHLAASGPARSRIAGVADAEGGSDGVGGPEPAVGRDDDPLQRIADEALNVLAGVARSEAGLAALKAQAVVVFAEATRSLNGPPSTPHEATAQERSVVAEVGCALAIGDRAAGALLFESFALSSSLPLTLAALQAGTLSWQHARTMVEQTASLDPAGAAALETHFLDPDAPPTAKGPPHRGNAGIPVQSQGQDLAGTPSPRITRETPRHVRRGPARRVLA